MKVVDILNQERTRISIEVLPPREIKRDDATLYNQISNLFNTIEQLIDHNPAFISVTYHEGKTKASSIPIAALIKDHYNVESVAHLTSFGMNEEKMKRTIEVLKYFQIENVLALQGDPPKVPMSIDRDFQYASDLVKYVSNHDYQFCIGVAGYPEGHPECLDTSNKRNLEMDLDIFEEKINNGANFAISQVFLDNSFYFDYIKRSNQRGLSIPIIPGILPITDFKTVEIVKDKCKSMIPPHFQQKIKNADEYELLEIGIEHAIQQCKGLIDKVPCIHFYTMDVWEPTDRIIREVFH